VSRTRIDAGLEALALAAQTSKKLSGAVAGVAARYAEVLRRGGTLYFCGNGGSAADAQHIAAELSGRFYRNRPGLAAVALTVNSSALTAIGNDFGFHEVFARQLEGLARPGDVLLAVSTSGSSANVLAAIEKAKSIGMQVVGMTGERGTSFAARCDLCLVVPSADTPRIQEAHICAGHTVCLLVEEALFGEGSR
jgi:D-sedoheptulose 7-phosphate isomerase